MRVTKDMVAVTVLAIILATLSIVSIFTARTAGKNQLDRAHFANYVECLFEDHVDPKDCRSKL